MARYVTQLRVGWPDVDLVGIVYFPRFFGYFEHAELEWVRSHGIKYSSLLEKLGIWMPRAAAHSNYHAPARLDDVLAIEMRLARLGKTSFTFGFEVFRLPERERLVDGYIVIATVSRARFRPIAVPGALRDMLLELADADTEGVAGDA